VNPSADDNDNNEGEEKGGRGGGVIPEADNDNNKEGEEKGGGGGGFIRRGREGGHIKRRKGPMP
jgi:hypothetical protein